MTAHHNVLPRCDDAPAHVHRLAEDGYSVIPGFINPAAIPALRDEVMMIIRHTQPPHPQLQQTSQYLHSSCLDTLINSPEFLHITEALCEGPCCRFLPFTAVKAPGGGTFQYHQDDQYRLFDGYGVNFWIALDHVNEHNGCLFLVPGSHRLGPLPWEPTGDANNSRMITWTPNNAIPVPLGPGDCVVFDRLTIHSSGPNNTTEHRAAYSVTFHRDDVRFFDDGEWKLLRAHSCWRTPPTDELRRFTDMPRGGHR